MNCHHEEPCFLVISMRSRSGQPFWRLIMSTNSCEATWVMNLIVSVAVLHNLYQCFCVWVLLPFVLHACHFWQLLTVKEFEDVTAAKCFSLAACRRLFCCQHNALAYWLLGINLAVCVCVCVWHGSNFISRVSHSSLLPFSLLLWAVFLKMLLFVSEKENEIISPFLCYKFRRIFFSLKC